MLNRHLCTRPLLCALQSSRCGPSGAAVIGQKISFREARRNRAALYTTLNAKPGDVGHKLVTAAKVIELWDKIMALFPAIARDSVLQISQDVGSGTRTLATVKDVMALQTFRGIGPWTVTNTIVTSGVDMDTFPIADLFLKKKLATMEIRDPAVWAPYRTTAARIIWMLS